MNNTQEDFKHKILFFFMPSSITFLNNSKNDDEFNNDLKKISPFFYWCSAHEFKNLVSENKFLFQYQIYSIEDGQIYPGEVVQKWVANKNNIKFEIINFIEKWNTHERLIINAKAEEENVKNFITIPIKNNTDMELFSTFAEFVGRSIVSLQNIYIKESSDNKLDLLQKRFWEDIAMQYKKLLEENAQLDKKLKKTKKKIKKR